ncbi:unnamed protein product [Nippostrongylus brasiliensis]|uniref:Serine/arginine repetitive matrix protein 2-like n=1 Tax=Nippostrongylus brasiliensis TaxID=27835 RepID=A0A0N4XJU5_NIPBR|nr:unnamed protein product [Nippostrongylus brasiliensis]
MTIRRRRRRKMRRTIRRRKTKRRKTMRNRRTRTRRTRRIGTKRKKSIRRRTAVTRTKMMRSRRIRTRRTRRASIKRKKSIRRRTAATRTMMMRSRRTRIRKTRRTSTKRKISIRRRTAAKKTIATRRKISVRSIRRKRSKSTKNPAPVIQANQIQVRREKTRKKAQKARRRRTPPKNRPLVKNQLNPQAPQQLHHRQQQRLPRKEMRLKYLNRFFFVCYVQQEQSTVWCFESDSNILDIDELLFGCSVSNDPGKHLSRISTNFVASTRDYIICYLKQKGLKKEQR